MTPRKSFAPPRDMDMNMLRELPVSSAISQRSFNGARGGESIPLKSMKKHNNKKYAFLVNFKLLSVLLIQMAVYCVD